MEDAADAEEIFFQDFVECRGQRGFAATAATTAAPSAGAQGRRRRDELKRTVGPNDLETCKPKESRCYKGNLWTIKVFRAYRQHISLVTL